MQYKATKSEDAVERVKAKREAVLKKPQQELEAWIDANIEDIDDVKDYLKRLSRVVKSRIKFED
jgi:hypothetical protein|tara:strand:- start:51 stop:242 length:192 start_codon:yes stop_codon:yes gene_type:complete